MAIEVSALGLLTAVAAGAVSFISPCVLPLVPGYIYRSSPAALTAMPSSVRPMIRCHAWER